MDYDKGDTVPGMDTRGRILAIINDVFPGAGKAEDLADVPGWDSLQHLSLVLALEEEFGIMYSPEQIEAMRTVGDIVGMTK